MRISDWSSDVCSSDLVDHDGHMVLWPQLVDQLLHRLPEQRQLVRAVHRAGRVEQQHQVGRRQRGVRHLVALDPDHQQLALAVPRSEEHTSELQSLMRISYAVFCLKKKNKKIEKYYNY